MNIRPTYALLFLSFAAPYAVAQQDASDRRLEEVVVTAQKRAESLQDVPMSVSALTSSDLESLNLRAASDIAAYVPNLQATTTLGESVPIFSLRGVSMSDFSFNQSSPVAVYVDEVYKGVPALQGVQLYDLERVEVLRGPQGTLYGKNTTGGAVNFNTREPSMETGGEVNFGFGSYSRRKIEAAFETALVEDVLGFRIAGSWNEADGWFENRQRDVADGNAIDEYGIRATFLWQPSDTFAAILRVSTSKQEAVNYGIQAFNVTPDGVGAGLYGLYNLLGATTATDYFRTDRDFFEFDSDQDSKRLLENDAVAVTINWEVNDRMALTSITSWDDGEIFVPEDADGSPNAVLRIPNRGKAEQYAQDLRLTSSYEGAFNFIAGLYLANEETSNGTTIGFWTDIDFNTDGVLDFNDCLDPFFTSLGLGQVTPEGAAVEGVLNGFGLSLANFVPGGCQVQNEFDQERDSYSTYFDGRWDVSDTATIRFGLRYTDDQTELNNYSARILGNDFVPLLNTIPGDPVDPFAAAARKSFADQELSGKIGIDYSLDSGALLYASYSRGYRSGAFNSQAFFDPSELTQVEPEELDSIEIGIKTELLEGRLRLNAAAFHYKYNNQQFLNVDAVTAAQTLINIDESEITGLEAEITAIPVDNLLIRAGIGILDSEVKRGSLGGVDLVGNELLLAPGENFNLSANWTVLNFDVGSVSLMADTAYVGDHYFEIFNIPRIEQEAYWVWNSRVQFDSANENWSAAIWGKNLADERYRTSTIDLAAFGFDYSHIGAPRTYGAEFTYRF